MNLFILHEHPAIAAKMHCDKHVVKMILETAQLLCTAHHELGTIIPDDVLYRKTHINHPCAKWVRESSANYEWAYALFQALTHEYSYRYGKVHLSWRKLGHYLAEKPKNIRYGKQTPFAQAMPEQYRHSDPVIAYRSYYLGEKAHIAAWTRRRAPTWFLEELAA